VVAFIGLSVMAAVVPGISVSGPGAGALAVVVFWAFNLLIRPVILALFAPISTILVIAASLVLQVAAILILEPLVPGVEISGIPAAFVGSWVFAIVNTILTAILSISEDDSHFGALVRRLRMQRADAIHTAAPGLVIVQMDGLSNDVLKQQHIPRRDPVRAVADPARDHGHTAGVQLLLEDVIAQAVHLDDDEAGRSGVDCIRALHS
jgi:putative membrane protein